GGRQGLRFPRRPDQARHGAAHARAVQPAARAGLRPESRANRRYGPGDHLDTRRRTRRGDYMATIVKMPKWGLTMTGGTLTCWLKSEGDESSAGDPLLVVETEKAVNAVDAPTDGVLLKIVAVSGPEVPVSAAMAIIGAPGESLTQAEIESL